MKAIHPVGVGEPGWGISSGTHFRVYEHTTGALELGTGNGNDGTKITMADCGTAEDEWMELIYKYNHGTKPAADGSTNAPTQSLILELSPGTLNGMAFVIKEVSFYHDPTFTAEKWEESKRIIKIAGGSGFHNAMDNSKISYTLNDGKITLANIKAGAKINVYSLSGMLMKQIKSEDTTATFSLDKGYYTINVDGQNIKVLN